VEELSCGQEAEQGDYVLSEERLIELARSVELIEESPGNVVA